MYTYTLHVYTHMRALTLRIRVRVTESYTENCTCDKMADLTAVSSNYLTKHLSRIHLFYFATHVTLKSLVFLVGRVIARDVRLELTDRQTHTHRPSTVTLAAHARRGLITFCKALEHCAYTYIMYVPK